MTPNAPLTAPELRSILADMLEGAAARLKQRSGEPAELQRTVTSAVAVSAATIPPGEKLTLTVSEAADRLGIGRSSLYEAIRSGTIPSLRIGRRLLVPTHALHQRLDELAHLHASSGGTSDQVR